MRCCQPPPARASGPAANSIARAVPYHLSMEPMVRTAAIPSISELRAFEAVARLRSVSAAAQELGCSQPCVSHRLKALERRWSTELFMRTARAMEWTDRTAGIYERVCSLLREIEELAGQFDADDASERLTITAPASFVSSWLISRLPSFRERFPAIELKLSATNRYVDLASEDFDLGIRLLPRGASSLPDLIGTELASERLIVVAAPACAGQWSNGCEPADLRHASLIWQEGTDHWPRFFRRFLGADARAPGGISFNNADLVTRAAVENQGVAIMRELLVADDIRNGRLVRLMEHSVDCSDAYHLVATRERFARLAVQRFRAWLKEEIGDGPGR